MSAANFRAPPAAAAYLRRVQTSSFLGVLSILSVAPQAFVAVDAALSQHPIKSLKALRKEVSRWRDEHQSQMSDADCERLVGWLNRNFYRLED
jgi:hypothetical protein